MHHNEKSSWLSEELDCCCFNSITDLRFSKEHKILMRKSGGHYPLFPSQNLVYLNYCED